MYRVTPFNVCSSCAGRLDGDPSEVCLACATSAHPMTPLVAAWLAGLREHSATRLIELLTCSDDSLRLGDPVVFLMPSREVV